MSEVDQAYKDSFESRGFIPFELLQLYAQLPPQIRDVYAKALMAEFSRRFEAELSKPDWQNLRNALLIAPPISEKLSPVQMRQALAGRATTPSSTIPITADLQENYRRFSADFFDRSEDNVRMTAFWLTNLLAFSAHRGELSPAVVKLMAQLFNLNTFLGTSLTHFANEEVVKKFLPSPIANEGESLN